MGEIADALVEAYESGEYSDQELEEEGPFPDPLSVAIKSITCRHCGTPGLAWMTWCNQPRILGDRLTLKRHVCPKLKMDNSPRCTYCSRVSKLVTGGFLYPDRKDLVDRNFYFCEHCQAWVGCLPNTSVALGTLANASLRRARAKVHCAVDPLWKSGQMSRSDMYEILSREMNLSKNKCHIGLFTEAQCEQAINVITKYQNERANPAPPKAS